MVFNNDTDVDDIILPYDQDIQAQNREQFDETYVEAQGKKIGTHIMVTSKEYITIITKVRRKKRDHSDNRVENSNKNPILYIIIYELEFIDGRVEE